MIEFKYRFIEFFVFDYDFLPYFLSLFSGRGLLFLSGRGLLFL